MGIPFAIVLVVGVIAAVLALVWVMTTRRRTSPATAAERAVTHRRDDFPHAGETAPRKDGSPMPGSEEDRNLHGKP